MTQLCGLCCALLLLVTAPQPAVGAKRKRTAATRPALSRGDVRAVDTSVVQRGLAAAAELPTHRVLAEAGHWHKDVAHRSFNGTVLGYVTPWWVSRTIRSASSGSVPHSPCSVVRQAMNCYGETLTLGCRTLPLPCEREPTGFHSLPALSRLTCATGGRRSGWRQGPVQLPCAPTQVHSLSGTGREAEGWMRGCG
jgi:hypothetical protein